MLDCQSVRTEGLGRVSRATLLRVASATVTLVTIPMRDNRSVCPIKPSGFSDELLQRGNQPELTPH